MKGTRRAHGDGQLRLRGAGCSRPRCRSGNLLMLNYYYCPAEGGSCTSKNGNMLRQKITAGGALLATQDYAYDVLDRLKTATEGRLPGCVPLEIRPPVELSSEAPTSFRSALRDRVLCSFLPHWCCTSTGRARSSVARVDLNQTSRIDNRVDRDRRARSSNVPNIHYYRCPVVRPCGICSDCSLG